LKNKNCDLCIVDKQSRAIFLAHLSFKYRWVSNIYHPFSVVHSNLICSHYSGNIFVSVVNLVRMFV
jgi:hypothetical protein